MPSRNKHHPPDKPNTPGGKGGYRKEAGRKPHPINLETVERGYSLGCTQEEVALLVGMTEAAFEARVVNDPKLREAKDRGKALGRVTLRRLQWKGAQNGNSTMLVWLGKQLLGQRDQIDVTTEPKQLPIDMSAYSSEELATLRAAAALIKRGQEQAALPAPTIIEHDSADSGADDEAA